MTSNISNKTGETMENRWEEIDQLNQLVDEMEEAGLIKRDGPQYLYELLVRGNRKRKIKTYEEITEKDKKN